MIFHAALLLSLLESLALALVLWLWARRVSGAWPLIWFLIGVSLWIAGNELPAWFGPSAQWLGLRLLATAALTSAVFLDFAVVLTRTQAKGLVRAGYAIAIPAMLLSMIFEPGGYIQFAGINYVAVPNATGWVTSAVWALVAGTAQIVLLRATIVRSGLQRRQIGAALAASAWGLFCMTGYASAALNLPIPPWQLLGLPVYPVFLVYGILRYELLIANAWARRAVAWTILVTLAGLVVAAVPLLPFGDLWEARLATAAGTGAAFLLLGGPVRRLAERIVYPGGVVTPTDLESWRTGMAQAKDQPELAQRAAEMLSERLSTPVRVTVGESTRIGLPPPSRIRRAPVCDPAEDTVPRLACRRDTETWQAVLESGWDGAPPGPRHAATMLGTMLAEAAQTLEQAAALAAQERERQTQARLAELGALAAAVAHDVRNPLNIIGMAVAGTPPEVRTEVTGQIRRIARLTDDLLEYARPWAIAAAPFDLAALARESAARHAGVELLPGLSRPLPVTADRGRIEQAIGNLLDNARAVAAHVALDADRDGTQTHLHVCDDGPGVPEEVRERLFEPFVSRGTGGTGLGLAIVARIAAAHGGSVALTQRAGWSTCFTLSLPAAA